MSVFTMINFSTKELGEEKEFKNYIEAGKYCKENYGKGWEAKHEPLHFTSSLRKMFKEGTHPRIKTDNRGNVSAIIGENNEVLHCGLITLGEWDSMNRAGIKNIQISRYNFVKLHNSLIK